MIQETQVADRVLCLDVVKRFYLYLDQSRYTDLVALMSAEAEWLRQGNVLSGHAVIVHALEKRSKTRAIVHLLSNMWVEIASPSQATVHGYQVAYSYDNGSVLSGPAPLHAPGSIAAVRVDVVKEQDIWWISHVASTRLFTAPAPAHQLHIEKE